MLSIYQHIANTFQQQNQVILIHCFEDVCVVVVTGKSVEGEKTRAFSHTLQRWWQHAPENTSGFPTSGIAQKGTQLTSARAGRL